jgi:hypothetical protein
LRLWQILIQSPEAYPLGTYHFRHRPINSAVDSLEDLRA